MRRARPIQTCCAHGLITWPVYLAAYRGYNKWTWRTSTRKNNTDCIICFSNQNYPVGDRVRCRCGIIGDKIVIPRGHDSRKNLRRLIYRSIQHLYAESQSRANNYGDSKHYKNSSKVFKRVSTLKKYPVAHPPWANETAIASHFKCFSTVKPDALKHLTRNGIMLNL